MMTTPTLALVATHTAATTYHFQTTGDGFPSWALCTVNDRTGELHIMSDHGHWSHRWHTAHLGAPSLTAFLGERAHDDVDYIAGKLQGRRGGRRFDAAATIASWRRTLCERRLERRIIGSLAREIWDALGDAADEYGESEDLFLDRVYQIDGFAKHVDLTPYESLATAPTPEDRALREVILPALIAACRAATTATAEESPCAP